MQVRAEVTRQLRIAVIKRDHGMCRYCTLRPKWQNIEVDHVRPVISGGKSTMENCVTACRSCNQKKPVPLRRGIEIAQQGTALHLSALRLWVDRDLVHSTQVDH